MLLVPHPGPWVWQGETYLGKPMTCCVSLIRDGRWILKRWFGTVAKCTHLTSETCSCTRLLFYFFNIQSERKQSGNISSHGTPFRKVLAEWRGWIYVGLCNCKSRSEEKSVLFQGTRWPALIYIWKILLVHSALKPVRFISLFCSCYF